MPVYKYRSIEEMPGVPRREPGDPALYRAIRSIWELGDRMTNRRFRPGVTKYRSIEEMDRAQEEWAAAAHKDRSPIPDP
jgi:hypothetical protein